MSERKISMIEKHAYPAELSIKELLEAYLINFVVVK